MVSNEIIVAIVGGVFALAYSIFIGVIIWRAVKNERGQAELLLKHYENKRKSENEDFEETKKESNDFLESLKDNKED